LESALEAYNSPGSRDKIQGAAEYINDAANDKNAPEAVRKRAKQMLELDKYRNKVSARAVKDIETAEEILGVIIERAPSLLQLEAVEAA
jgi:uncharacterized protein (UPF0147 family)